MTSAWGGSWGWPSVVPPSAGLPVGSATIKAALETYLRALGALQGLVKDRIYFGERPQGTPLPALTFFRSGGSTVQISEGQGNMGIPRFSLECWGQSGEEAEAVALAVRGPAGGPGLEDWAAGFMGSIWVGAVRVDEMGDDKVPPAFGNGASDHRVTLDVTIWHDE